MQFSTHFRISKPELKLMGEKHLSETDQEQNTTYFACLFLYVSFKLRSREAHCFVVVVVILFCLGFGTGERTFEDF